MSMKGTVPQLQNDFWSCRERRIIAGGITSFFQLPSQRPALESSGERLATSHPREPGRRRIRRDIRQLILRELSFSGEAMTATQIAKAVDYQLERTEIALQRMEETGQVLRNEAGRWAIGNTAALAQFNGHGATGINGRSRSMPDAVEGSI